MSAQWCAALLLLLGLVLLVWAVVAWLRRRRRAAPRGGNVTDAMWWLWEQLHILEPSSELGGIYAAKAGYHNARQNLPPYDYSVVDDPPDQGGPSWAAAAIDWTFPNAQRGDYSTIALYTQRLLASAQDGDDDRLNGWREFYGNADSDEYVEGWDCRYGCAATSDSSHLWHIHLSENRDQTESYDNKRALLSVLAGETLAQWRGQMGESAVILNDPRNPGRLDLLYVGSDGSVLHRWYPNGMTQMWSGGGGVENIEGGVYPGTLSASWLPDGTAINVVGLGAPDEPACPIGCGQYWGYQIGRSGAKSGWGSLAGVYGAIPGGETIIIEAAYDG